MKKVAFKLYFILFRKNIRNLGRLDLNIECSNRTKEDCLGEFVLSIFDTCYFLYNISQTYKIIEANELCLKKNKTEVDYPTRLSNDVLLHFLLVLSPIINNKPVWDQYVPWKYLSKF